MKKSAKNTKNVIIKEPFSLDQAFFIACEANNFDSALRLLPNITDVNARNPINNYTGFAYAVNYKNLAAVQASMKKGADVNAVFGIAPWKTTALKMLASEEFDDNVGQIFYLIWSRGGDILQRCGGEGESVLTTIYNYDNYDLMNLLLKFKAGNEIFLGHPIEQVIYLLQQGNRKGILKAFEENGVIASVQETIDAFSGAEHEGMIVEGTAENDIIKVEVAGENALFPTL